MTRVPSSSLEALEREDFGSLPAPVFTKGYIRAYCQVVGAPADEALMRYAESTGTPVPAAALLAPRTADNGGRGRGTLLVSFVLLVGFGLALFVVTLFLQSGRPDGDARRTEPPVPAVDPRPLPAAAPVPAAPPPAPAPRLDGATPAPSPATRPATDISRPSTGDLDLARLGLGAMSSPYRLVARTSESTWLLVRTEDGRVTEETIPAGEVREWVSNRPFILTVGNAGGITLELNGRTLPPLGGRGAVITRLVLPPTEP